MTKHPQSRLGYAVNGVVVFKPRTSSHHAPPERTPTSQGHQSRNQKNNKTARLESCYHFNRSEMEDLKNACKTGNLMLALKSAFHLLYIRKTRFRRWWNSSRMEGVVRILFTPDIENRTATYYAAHAGHADLVYVFLSLLVMSRVSRKIVGSYKTKSKTIVDWLRVFGFPVYFGPSSFQTCILNALNQEVKAVFQKTKYSLSDLMQSGTECPEFETLLMGHRIRFILGDYKQPPQIQSHKKRRPSLVVEADDEYDQYSEYGDECVDEAKLEDDDDHDYNQYSLQQGVECFEDEAAQISECADGLEELDLLQATIDLYESMGIDELSHQVLPSDETTANDEKDPDEWSCITSNASFDLVDISDLESENNDSQWEVTSEVSSVVTLDSVIGVKESYLDMARKGKVQETTRFTSAKINNKMPAPRKLAMQPSIQEDEPLEDDLFDAYFVMEGIKCARGGKQKTMFKGNQKVSR